MAKDSTRLNRPKRLKHIITSQGRPGRRRYHNYEKSLRRLKKKRIKFVVDFLIGLSIVALLSFILIVCN